MLSSCLLKAALILIWSSHVTISTWSFGICAWPKAPKMVITVSHCTLLKSLTIRRGTWWGSMRVRISMTRSSLVLHLMVRISQQVLTTSQDISWTSTLRRTSPSPATSNMRSLPQPLTVSKSMVKTKGWYRTGPWALVMALLWTWLALTNRLIYANVFSTDAGSLSVP